MTDIATRPRGKNGFIDITGERFGSLTVVDRGVTRSARKSTVYWNCVCDCGNTTSVVAAALRGGTTKSCGCMRGRYPHAKLPLLDRFWELVDKRGLDECWPWKGFRSNGYGQFQLGVGEGLILASRFVLEIKTGMKHPPTIYACHSCDNPPCCNPKHIFPGTNDVNRADSVAKKRHAFGSRHGVAKLIEADIPVIRQMARDGAPYGEIAAKFGITFSSASNVARKKTWKHVPGEGIGLRKYQRKVTPASSSVRDENDRFDLDKVEAVCMAVYGEYAGEAA